MFKILVWGLGKRCNTVLGALRYDKCEVIGFIDNNPEKAGTEYAGKRVFAFKDAVSDFDYLVISALSYESILYQLQQVRFDMEKVVVFYDMAYTENTEYWSFIDEKTWKIAILEEKVKALESLVESRFSNIGYEIIDSNLKNKYQYPVIAEDEELIDKIVNGHCSFIRFGDGEFEIMRGNERAPFQTTSAELAQRLEEVISAKDDKILIGIADNYGNLDKYTEQTAQGIRQYMTDEVREFHLSVLNPDRTYYNAYIFKTYMPYKDKERTTERVALVRKVWDDRDVIFIEGAYTRTGYGNDLFDNAKSVKRILCPTKNAYDKYDEILACAKKIDKNCLILVVLGPAGKILTYDLVQEGYQVIDIGQIDMDYDWYSAGVDFRIPNPVKYVSQLPPAEVIEIEDENYIKQVIARVGI